MNVMALRSFSFRSDTGLCEDTENCVTGVTLTEKAACSVTAPSGTKMEVVTIPIVINCTRILAENQISQYWSMWSEMCLREGLKSPYLLINRFPKHATKKVCDQWVSSETPGFFGQKSAQKSETRVTHRGVSRGLCPGIDCCVNG